MSLFGGGRVVGGGVAEEIPSQSRLLFTCCYLMAKTPAICQRLPLMHQAHFGAAVLVLWVWNALHFYLLDPSLVICSPMVRLHQSEGVWLSGI